jgi:(p)ppGpp synthase/HD superfamily hydrolase
VGYITLNRGVTVHRADCPNVQSADETDRLVEVSWGQTPLQVSPVPVRVEALDRAGLLRDIAAMVAEENINMSSANVSVSKDNTSVITATLEITDINQLSRVLNKIETIPDVLDARRESG